MLIYETAIYPCLGLTPATERWDGRSSHALHADHLPLAHPRSVDIVSGAISCTCTDQHSALVADPLWAIPETRRSRDLTPVACRRADPASRPVVLLAKQQKSLQPLAPAVYYFDLGFVVGMPGGGMYEQRGVSKLKNIIILSPELGSAPSN